MIINTIYMNNTKIANELRKYHNQPGMEYRINVGRRERPIPVRYRIDADLTPFDCMAADAVYTLLRNGYTSFSLGQVLRVMSGDERQTLTREKKQALEESIRRLSGAYLEIDCRKELRHRGGERDDSGRIYGIFLPVRRKGKCSYEITGSLPLYEYAEMNRQIIAFLPKLLQTASEDAGERMSNTEERMLMKHYLIRRLELMRSPQNSMKERRIIYIHKSHSAFGGDAGMFPEIGLVPSDYSSEASWKNKRQKVHGSVCRILDYYQKIGYIEGYAVEKGEHGLVKGVEIQGEIFYSFDLLKINEQKYENQLL